MDVKELNKSQLILLAILLSFVTSIATGITTVTLMQQAPTSVTVPINRVVKQTVEKIVPGVVTNNTVIVKEEDLVVDAIAKSQSAVFSVTKEIVDENGETIEVSAGRGVVISNNDTIVVDSSFISDKGIFYIKNDSGKFKGEFVQTYKQGFSVLKIGAPLDEKNKLAYTVPAFGDVSKMKAGQKVIVLGSTISSFMYDGSSDFKLSGLKSNAGALVLDLNGEMLGLALSGENSFVSINAINEALKPATSDTTSKTQ